MAPLASFHRGRGMSVLVVDRRPAWTALLEPALRRAGVAMAVVDSGAAMFRRLRRAPARVVVFDTSVDDYPPAVTLPMLRELHPSTAVIVTSDYMTPSLAEVLKETPPFHTAVKPMRAETIRAVVADALNLPALVA